nr:fibroblast growth factor 17-like isoform X1 [Rhipicephalus microplus]
MLLIFFVLSLLFFRFVVPITLTLLVSLVMVKCQDFNLTNNLKKLRSYDKGSSIRIEYVLYNRCSRGNIHIKGKKVTATPGNSFSKLVLSSVGMGSELTIGSNSTFLCFNKGGRLVNKRRMSRRKGLCEFREIMRDNYSTFQSVYNGNWYIGFNSKGKPVRGRKVPPHRWFQFMFLKRGNEDIPRSPFANVSQAEWLKVLNDTSTNKS